MKNEISTKYKTHFYTFVHKLCCWKKNPSEYDISIMNFKKETYLHFDNISIRYSQQNFKKKFFFFLLIFLKELFTFSLSCSRALQALPSQKFHKCICLDYLDLVTPRNRRQVLGNDPMSWHCR